MSEFLITDSLEQAQAYVAALDKLCGYPCAPTKTETSVRIETLKDGRFLVPLPDGVFAPVIGKYLESRAALPIDRQKEAAVATAKDVVLKDQPLGTKDSATITKFCVVSDTVATELSDSKASDPITGGDAKPK